MKLDELRDLAVARFGERLERATPGGLAEFLTELQPMLPGTQIGGAVSVDGAADSYEDAMRQYFAGMLAARPERAAASLWVTAVEMWLGAIADLPGPE